MNDASNEGMIKIRKITTIRPQIYIFLESTATNEVQGTNPAVYTNENTIAILKLYLEDVCDLANSDYFLASSCSNTPPNTLTMTVSYNVIIIIVDEGVFIPILSNVPGNYPCISGSNENGGIPIYYPNTSLIGTTYSGFSLPTMLLYSNSFTPLISAIQPIPQIGQLFKVGNFHNVFADDMKANLAGAPNLGELGFFRGYSYDQLGLYDFNGAIQFAYANYIDNHAYTGNATFQTYLNNIDIQIPKTISETRILADRILSRDFTSIKDLIRENPLLFIKYGVYLLIVYRYAETKVINPLLQ